MNYLSIQYPIFHIVATSFIPGNLCKNSYFVRTPSSGCLHLGMENISKAGSIGKAGYSWSIRIVDKYGSVVNNGEIGELAVKGTGMMSG